MRTVDELFQENVRYCYWLNECESDPGKTGRLRVSIVFEGEPGHFPTGGDDVAPWYWDQETCRQRNAKLGLTEEDVFKIVASSMFHQRRATA